MQLGLFFGSVLSFTLGVGGQILFTLPSELILLLLLISLGIGVVWRRNQTAASAPVLLVGSVLICGFALGLLRAEVASWQFGSSPLQTQVEESISFTGTVITEPKRSVNTTQLYVSDGVDTLFVSVDRHSLVSYGDRVIVSGTLALPQSFTTELGRTFDYPG